MLTPLIIAAIAGYLLGSLPFGYLVARAQGVNIFDVGSHSPGSTNVRRVLGNGPGNLVLVLDTAKGAAAALAPYGWRLLPGHGAGGFGPHDYGTFALAGLVGAIVGHSFSCFTRFLGGKGVATAAGGLIVLFPPGAIVAVAVWGATVVLTRYVSLASILAAVSLPASAFFFHRSPLFIGAAVVIAVFVIMRHRANIRRLLAGTENKLGQRKTGKSNS